MTSDAETPVQAPFGMRLGLVAVMLTTALFLAPMSAILTKLISPQIAALLADLCLGLLILFLGAQLAIGGKLRVFIPSTLDIWMLGWLAYGLVAFDRTYLIHDNLLTTVIVMRYMFVIPIAYFAFRVAIQTPQEFAALTRFYILLLKVSVAYLLVEFVLVNFFGMGQTLEVFFSRSGSWIRLYDGFAGSWHKPAGPIQGSQNSSFLGLIATITLQTVYRKTRQLGDLAWALAGLLAFMVSISLTAVLSGVLLIALFQIELTKAVPRKVLKWGAFALVALGVFFRRQIIAFRDVGSVGAHSYEKVAKMAQSAIHTFTSSALQFPFGTGWPNHLNPFDWASLSLLRNAPAEVFLLKMSYYLGSVFLAYFLAFHVYLLIRLKRIQNETEHGFSTTYISVVVFALFFSTLHYETFTRFGFIYLYAFCLAGVPLLYARALPKRPAAMTAERTVAEPLLVQS